MFVFDDDDDERERERKNFQFRYVILGRGSMDENRYFNDYFMNQI